MQSTVSTPKSQPAQTLEEFRAEVSAAVTQIHGHKKWFKGVCMDGVTEFYPNRLAKAIDHAVDETYGWDGDWCGAQPE